MLTESLQSLTQSFSEAVMAAIHSTPIGELTSLAHPMSVMLPMTPHTDRAAKDWSAIERGIAAAGKTSASREKKRLPRRTPEMIEVAVKQVVVLLKKHPAGLRAEAIRGALDLDVREVPAILKAGVASKVLKVLSGQKRSTTYGLAGARKAPKAKGAKKVVKKASAKSTKKAPKKAMKRASKKSKK